MYKCGKINSKILLLFFAIILSGCLNNRVIATLKDKNGASSPTITNVQVQNNQIILTGTNLNSINNFKINDGVTDTILAIESHSATSLVANTLSNFTISAGKVLNFIISNADASATFTVNFSLCDSTLGGKAFNCSAIPNDKDVLSYDATSGKWKPRAINGLTYQGLFDASSGAAPGSNNIGDYYIVKTAGTISGVYYSIGDWIVLSAVGDWERINNSTVITSVFGRSGAITATKGDYVLNKMGDVDLTTTPPNSGDVLKFNGTNWVPGTVSGAGGGTVTAVSGTSPISVANGTSTPAITISKADTATNGYLSSADWNTFNGKQNSIAAGTSAQYYRGDKIWQTLDTSVVPENTNLYFTNARGIGSTITAPMLTNSAIASGDTLQVVAGKLQAQISASSTSISNKADQTNLTQTITAATVTGLTAPVAGSDAANKTYIDNIIASMGIWSKGAGSKIYYSAGNVGIGTNNPAVALDVQGQVKTSVLDVTGSSSVDWNNGNIQYTRDSCKAYSLSNLLDGGSYTFAVKGGTSAQCTFSLAGVTFHYTPTNALTNANTHTIYTFFRVGSDVYVSWTTGL